MRTREVRHEKPLRAPSSTPAATRRCLGGGSATPATWLAWFVFLRALFGLPMSEESSSCSALHRPREPPAGERDEVRPIPGRRGGQSIVLALVAVFLLVHGIGRSISPGRARHCHGDRCRQEQARVIDPSPPLCSRACRKSAH